MKSHSLFLISHFHQWERSDFSSSLKMEQCDFSSRVDRIAVVKSHSLFLTSHFHQWEWSDFSSSLRIEQCDFSFSGIKKKSIVYPKALQ